MRRDDGRSELSTYYFKRTRPAFDGLARLPAVALGHRLKPQPVPRQLPFQPDRRWTGCLVPASELVSVQAACVACDGAGKLDRLGGRYRMVVAREG